MKKFLPVLLILGLLLTGCGNQIDFADPTEATKAPATEAPATTAPADTVPPETEPVAYSPLTGLPMDEKALKRPYAVVVNNIIDAMPQYGIRDAEIIYEILAEGGITRCMGIFSDPTKTEDIGSIRSVRPYFADIALGYDAIFVHAGGSDAGDQEVADIGLDDIDGVREDGAYFYRNQDRLDSGYDMEHTLFITGEDIEACAVDKEFALTRDEELDYGLKFADQVSLHGAEAKQVTVTFSGGKETEFVYDPGTDLYGASQYGDPYIDGATDEQMEFRNIIMITAETGYDEEGYRLLIETTGSGTGWFVTGGKMVPIQWSRDSVSDPFVYTTEDGNPITLATGRTYIAVTPTGSEIICQ